MDMQITSKNNKIISHIKSLHKKKFRDKHNQLFIEGYRIVKDAFESKADFEYIIANSDKLNNELNEFIEALKQKNIKVYFVSEDLFKEISDTTTPQGILGVINKSENHLEDIVKNSDFLILLENVQDPGNMGTIIRTADAAGVSGIIISKGCVDIYNPKVLRSTMGSFFHIPIISAEDFLLEINKLYKEGYEVFAAHPHAQKNCYDIDMKRKTAIVIGNEANGVSEEILDKCTQISIPMAGNAESLNASIAASILIFEKVRQSLR